MSWWFDKLDFWRNKTVDNEIYARQKEEVVRDLKIIIETHKIQRVIDVGGYKGIVGTMLPNGIEYLNFDAVNGFDVTEEWSGQKGAKNLKKIPRTLVFTSLVLIGISPEKMSDLLNQIWKYGDHFYFYEEAFTGDHHDGYQLNGDYGGKWSYDWKRLLSPRGKFHGHLSQVNSSWVRMTEVEK